jgi:hypothetical protein
LASFILLSIACGGSPEKHNIVRQGGDRAAGDGIFVVLCQSEVQLRQLHLLCQSERG